ncbi:MAG: TolC family outer membrane protein [Rhodospirillaceae bacterium]|nr:TolC family outer membrane protein [Rhodospirillaceae bacterium]
MDRKISFNHSARNGGKIHDSASTLAYSLSLLTVIFAINAFPVQSQAKTLESELATLLTAHPKIKQAEASLESGVAGVDRARARYFPTVNISGDVGPHIIDSPSERKNNTNGDPWSRPRQTATAKITQNIFDGGMTSSLVRTAEINREIAEISLEGTRQNTMFEAIKSYIDVLRQRRLVEMAFENERTIQQQLNLEDERVRRGSGVTVDVLQAKSRLQIARERRVGYEGGLEHSISRYVQVFDHAPDIATMVDPSPPAEVIPSNRDRAIEIALLENPALINSATSVESAREKRNQASPGLLPVIDVVGSANYEKDNQATLGIRRDYSVVVKANWDIFSGFSSKAASNMSNFDYQASMENYDYTTRKVIEQVSLSWQSLLTAGERKNLLGNAVNIASEVASSRKKLREAGKETIINVLDAENEVNNAQINYTSSAYDERVAIYQLLLSMGRLNPEYLVLQ